MPHDRTSAVPHVAETTSTRVRYRRRRAWLTLQCRASRSAQRCEPREVLWEPCGVARLAERSLSGEGNTIPLDYVWRGASAGLAVADLERVVVSSRVESPVPRRAGRIIRVCVPLPRATAVGKRSDWGSTATPSRVASDYGASKTL